MKEFLRHISTGKDNQTHDVVRVAIIFVVSAMLLTMVIGIITYIYSYFYSLGHPEIKLFPLEVLFSQTSIEGGSIGGFLITGSASLLMKKTTEPDGSQTTTTSIKTGDATKEPEVTQVTETNISGPLS